MSKDRKRRLITAAIDAEAAAAEARIEGLISRQDGGETVADLRSVLTTALEDGAGIYRTEETLQSACETIDTLRGRFAKVQLKDKSRVFNTALIQALELSAMIEVASTLAHSALLRTESRGSHQRLDYTERDDEKFLKHSRAHYDPAGTPRIDYTDVVITKSQPAERLYGGAAEAAAAKAAEKGAASGHDAAAE